VNLVERFHAAIHCGQIFGVPLTSRRVILTLAEADTLNAIADGFAPVGKTIHFFSCAAPHLAASRLCPKLQTIV
jgi:hypothetical protein